MREMKALLKKIAPKFLIQAKRDFDECCRCLLASVSVAKELSKETGIPYWVLLLDMSLSALSCVAPHEYRMYRFHEKSRSARNRFLTSHRMRYLIQAFNRGDLALMKDKHLFNRHFSDFIGRQWLYAPDASDQQIEVFFDAQRQVIVKPSSLSGGSGVRKITCSELADIKAFCESARKDCLLLEECIKQHPDINSISSASVNTLRITTVVDRAGVPHILCAGLRMGRGENITDNLSGGGIIAQIDLDSGIIFTLAIGADLQTYIKHPTSGAVLPGFQIPHWEATKKMILHAAQMVPQVRWVAWDVAITAKEPLLIEGNASLPAPRAMQIAIQTGFYHLLRSYL